MPDIAPQMPDLPPALSVLENHYRHRPDAVVLGNCYLYKNPTLLDGQLYPHCLVSFGMTRPNAEITVDNDYTISELGKPPDFVLDIASNTPGRPFIPIRGKSTPNSACRSIGGLTTPAAITTMRHWPATD